MQMRAALVAIGAVLAPTVALLAACNDDGRTLRPARSDQTVSVSTLAPVTEPSTVGDGLGDAVIDAVESTAPPTTVLEVTAPFADGGAIDARYTCNGENVSPALTWSAAPVDTVEIAITVVDLDNPQFAHWAISAIDPLAASLGEGQVPEFAIQGTNGNGELGYAGPCPPNGETHSYRFTVHYLSEQTELADGVAGADLIAFIEASSLASVSVTGTYSQS